MFDFTICIAHKQCSQPTVNENEIYPNENEILLHYFPCSQAMYNARIVCHGILLLLAAASTDSTKCSHIIEGTTGPRSNAEGKYYFFMTLFNRTELVYAYMPSTRYSGKNIRNREQEDRAIDIISNPVIYITKWEK